MIIERTERSLDARQRLKLFVLQHLFDRTQTIRPFRMARRREVVQAGGMTEEESGHWLDLNARTPSWKCLSRFCSRLTPLGGGLLSGTKKSTCSG